MNKQYWKKHLSPAALLLWLLISSSCLAAQKLPLIASASQVECYDFLELTLNRKKGKTDKNPFVDYRLTAVFTPPGGDPVQVEGFCDAADGTVFRLRFMPTKPGPYAYTVRWEGEGKVQESSGAFQAVPSSRKGPLRVDPTNPWHFIYENTGEHFFWNSTTAYWMLGWKDERIIRESIDRLAAHGINRIRVAINGRSEGGQRWSEPQVQESDSFTFLLNPWVAARPQDLDFPGFDVKRFNLAHWQKLDRLVARAREKGMIVSLIFYVDGLDHGCDPFKKANMGNEDEQRYYRYAVARYAGFENIMWDVTNEYHLFRSEEWVNQMGALLKSIDPARHLISVHGHGDFPFRTSPWVDLVLYQSWDECGGYLFMINNRQKQAATGRIMPQVNEEYGYEGHYSPWGCGPTAAKERNGRSADSRRRLAWEMTMAGGYQTTGERADEPGCGGWINGRGNEAMTMLPYYRLLREIVEETRYWELDPRADLVNYGNLCLAKPGKQYLVYNRLAYCRLAIPEEGLYSVLMINPRTGERQALPDCDAARNKSWHYPRELQDDWVFILNRKTP